MNTGKSMAKATRETRLSTWAKARRLATGLIPVKQSRGGDNRQLQ